MESAQYSGSRNLGMVAGSGGGSMNAPTAQRTFAARLESTAYTLSLQCNRIEDTLAKINGTPRAPGNPGDKAEKIAVTAPLAQSVEALEQQAKRLCELANMLEQVA